MSETESTTTNFFDGIGEGSGAPGAVLKNVNDFVFGEIVRMFERDYVPFGKTEAEKDASGNTKKQLVIILQTDQRNWANVNKVPKVDHTDPNSPEKPGHEDTGERAVFVPEGKNIQFAIGRAVTAAGAKFEVGGTLGVKVFNLKPTDKGNPLKEHEAVYKPKPPAAAGAEFFSAPAAAAPAAPAPATQPAAPAQQAYAQGSSFGGGDRGLNAPAPTTVAQPVAPAPAPVAQPAAPAPAPAQDPWATPAAAPVAGDPWAAPAAPAAAQPPF